MLCRRRMARAGAVNHVGAKPHRNFLKFGKFLFYDKVAQFFSPWLVL